MTDTDITRESAMALARTGALLNGRELMAILVIKPSWFYTQARHGKFNFLKVSVPVGTRVYSGTLVCRWVDGKNLDDYVSRPFAK